MELHDLEQPKQSQKTRAKLKDHSFQFQDFFQKYGNQDRYCHKLTHTVHWDRSESRNVPLPLQLIGFYKGAKTTQWEKGMVLPTNGTQTSVYPHAKKKKRKGKEEGKKLDPYLTPYTKSTQNESKT